MRKTTHGWVAAAVDSLVGNVVGARNKPQSTYPIGAVRGQCERLEWDPKTHQVALSQNETPKISFRQRFSDASLVREPNVFGNS